MGIDTLKKWGKHILLIIGIYAITTALVFVGFNLNYKDINLEGQLPTQVSIAKAEATKKDGRIYGYISNSKENNVNGKYIKTQVYNDNNEVLEVQYLKVDDVKYNEKKMFKVFFKLQNAKKYSIELVNNK